MLIFWHFSVITFPVIDGYHANTERVSDQWVPYWRLFIGEINVPGQKFCHFIARPLRQYTQDMAKVSLRIDTIQPTCSDQSVQQRTTLTTVIAAEEDVVLFTQAYRP